MSAAARSDLPRAAPGELMLYLLGPRVGESMVAVMPDGRVMVVASPQRVGSP